jgi:hypothetical protein
VGSTSLPLSATGTGIQPLYLSVSTLAFGNVGLNVPSAAKTVYLYNYTGSTLAAGAISVPLPGTTAPFAAALGTCANGVANNSSCTITVSFTPTATGGVLSTPLNVQVGSTSLPLSATGTGVTPLYLNVSTLAFGNVGVGTTSAKTVYLYNYTGSALAAGAILPGSAGPFTGALGTCANGVANNSSCTITVSFTPTATGGVLSTPLNVQVGSTSLPLSATGTGK